MCVCLSCGSCVFESPAENKNDWRNVVLYLFYHLSLSVNWLLPYQFRIPLIQMFYIFKSKCIISLLYKLKEICEYKLSMKDWIETRRERFCHFKLWNSCDYITYAFQAALIELQDNQVSYCNRSNEMIILSDCIEAKVSQYRSFHIWTTLFY